MNKKFLYFLFVFYTENAFADRFVPLAPSNPITGDISNPTNFMGLLNSIFRWGIAVAVTLAIIMITVGGLQYMTTDAISGKKDGKEKIKAAFAGLLLALSGWLILNTINPRIVNTEIRLDVLRTNIPNSENNIENNEIIPPDDGGDLPTGPLPNINWSDPSQKISKHFTVGDVTKGEQRRIPTDENTIRQILATARELDKVRDAWGSGIGVTSWYRPPTVNSSVGGASGSQHLGGRAVDIYPTNGNLSGLNQLLRSNWSGGMGTYSNFTHIDTRGGGGFTGRGPSATW